MDRTLFSRIFAKLKLLPHAYLGVQMRDCSEHLVILMDHGEIVYAEADGVQRAPTDVARRMFALVEHCVEDCRDVIITAIDEAGHATGGKRKAVYNFSYVDGQLVILDSELLAAQVGGREWEDLYKLVGD
jgi:hypothetical protein